MQINVTFDMTPEELRRVMGLPDVQEMEKMNSGEEGYDPMSLYQPLLNGGVNAMSEFQRMMFAMMSGKSDGKGQS